MAGGLTDRAWTVADLVKLLEDEERKLMKAERVKKNETSLVRIYCSTVVHSMMLLG